MEAEARAKRRRTDDALVGEASVQADAGGGGSSGVIGGGPLLLPPPPAAAENEDSSSALAAVRAELNETKDLLAEARREAALARKEMQMQELMHGAAQRSLERRQKEAIRAAEYKFNSELSEAKRKVRAEGEEDARNFEANLERYKQEWNEDMAKCELKLKLAQDDARSAYAVIEELRRSLAEVQAEALARSKAAAETHEACLLLERKSCAGLRLALSVRDRQVAELRAAVLERAAAELGGGGGVDAAAELVRLRAERRERVQELEQLRDRLEARERFNEGLEERLAESESKVKRLSDIEAGFNARLRAQATEIEQLRCRLIVSGRGTMWDEVGRATQAMATPRNVVYRESDGLAQMGGAARYAGPNDP
jgi:hypothetical protein